MILYAAFTVGAQLFGALMLAVMRWSPAPVDPEHRAPRAELPRARTVVRQATDRKDAQC